MMKYSRMYPQSPDADQNVRASLRDFSLKTFSIPVPGEGYEVEGLLCRRKNEAENKYFFKEKQGKNLAVIHFTAGFLAGDIPTLVSNKPNHHVSTNFLIGRDGTIYQLFSSAMWAYHLGRTAIGGNTLNSKRSVAIELTNVGPLTRSGNTLKAIGGLKDYCKISEKSAYHELDTPYRGFTYYASYTAEQYESLTILLRYLSNVYDIPREFLPVEKRDQLFASKMDARNFTGICSHVNFRSDKFDIGPGFDWVKLITDVQADSFTPTLTVKSRSILDPKPDFEDEASMEAHLDTMAGDVFNPDTMGEEGEEMPEQVG